MLTTRSLTPRLSEAARHVVIPSGIRTTSWPSVKAECKRLGIEFDPWQDGAGQVVFGRRGDGSYACSVGGVVFSIPRQVGKTFFLGAIVFALCMLNPGLLVIWTAHQLPTAGETHRAMAAIAKKRKIAPFIKQVRMGSGDESVEFTNGSRILFGARERGFGLGFTKVGVLILDEGQRLTEKTLDDLVPTMNQAVDPLMFIIGTPPRPTDRGEEFKRRRREALSGESDDMVYIECSADPEMRVSKWPLGKVDWAAVEQANPSYPTRTPKNAVLRMRKQLTAESFQREGLGIWDDDAQGTRRWPADFWATTAVQDAPQEGVRSFAVAFSQDGDALAIAGALKHANGVHVELVDAAQVAPTWSIDDGVEQLAEWLAERKAKTAQITVLGAAGAALVTALIEKGVPRRMIHVMTTTEVFAANAMAENAMRERVLTHPLGVDGDVLDASVAVSDSKKRGSGWGWIVTVDGGSKEPVEAFCAAYWTARMTKRVPGRKQVLL